MPKFNYDLAAHCIVWAKYYGDAKSRKKFEIAERTLRRYKERLASDPHLAASVEKVEAEYKRETYHEWAEEAKLGFRAAAEALKSVCARVDADTTSGKPVNPMLVAEVRQSAAMFADVALTKGLMTGQEAEESWPRDSTSSSLAVH